LTLLPTIFNCEYTFPGGAPKIREHKAFLANAILVLDPNKDILES